MTLEVNEISRTAVALSLPKTGQIFIEICVLFDYSVYFELVPGNNFIRCTIYYTALHLNIIIVHIWILLLLYMSIAVSSNTDYNSTRYLSLPVSFF